MQLSTIYNVFVRDFRKQKKRITLTLIALAWGTISIMLLLAFGEGLDRQLQINRKGLGDGIGILWGGQTSVPYKGLGKGRPIHLYKEDPAYLMSRIPELKHIGGEYHRWGVKVKYDEVVLSEHITGIVPEFEQMRSHISEMGGRMINHRDIKQRRRVVFLGWDLKERLFGDDDPVGKYVLIGEIPFIVIGVMKEKMQMGSYSGMDSDVAAIPNTTFKAIFGDPYLDNIIYQSHDVAQMDLVEQKIYQAMGAKYKFDPEDDRALGIWDVAAGAREMKNMMLGIKIFLGIIGGLTLLIAGVGVANIMYVSIKERTREIGVKMAVGARRSYVLTQFLLEAILITFGGGALGMAVSYLLTVGFQQIPLDSDAMSFLGRPIISPEIGIIVTIILGFMGLVSGFFPALKAASVSPAESLRYE